MALQHSNIVKVEDAGRTKDGRLYIAMEYLEKGSLEDKYRGRSVSLSVARKIVCDVCWGLEYAHQRGFVHRDVKPANILIGESGEAKLSDFGLATRAQSDGSASPNGYLTHLAPEVFHSGTTSCLSDIYALGVTAYRLINGDAYLNTPADLSELQDMIEEGHYPDRSHFRPYVPTQLRRIVNKAMHIDATTRYQSAAEFRNALEQAVILCNWRWKRKRDFVRYLATIGASKIKVEVRQESSRFEIVTTKSVNDRAARRVAKDCFATLGLPQMKSTLRKILCRYVTIGK